MIITPRRRQWLGWAIGAAASALAPPVAGRPSALAPPSAAPLAWRERVLRGFGTTLWLRAGHADEATVERGIDAAVDAIRHVERQMSLFDPDSALCRLNRDGVLHDPHPDLVAVLRLAADVSARSAGAFDVTVQPLWQLWRRAQQAGRLPGARALREARARVGWRGVSVRDERITFARPGMAITLNGIAQGYAADLAKARLLAHGIGDALLDTGEWQPLGRSPERGPWQLGVAHPHGADRLLATLVADGRAIACSSDATLAFSADRRHHHILDPRVGDSPPHRAAVVVAAPSCALADALTKVMFVGRARDALAAARRFGVDVLALDKDGAVAASGALRAA